MILECNLSKKELVKLLEDKIDFDSALLEFDNDIYVFLEKELEGINFTLHDCNKYTGGEFFLITNEYDECKDINGNKKRYYITKEKCTTSKWLI